ncbi:MAG: ribosome small subunit-dependent GTPase A [bacterium]|nr:ribosome small subunit-dependent GTPase A [bacterium]
MAGRKKKKTPRDAGRREPEGGSFPALAPDEGEPGLVVAHHGVAVLVRFESGEARQVWLQPEQRAVVGDRVRVARNRLAVEPARGVLRRRDPRGRERTIATNLDVLGIVVAPEPREPPGYIDRGFVIARSAGIEPILVMNKTDLDDGDELAARLIEIYAPSASVLCVCADRGEGLDLIFEALAGGRLGALVGPSGVGKSSLLNALVPDLDLRVSELNRGSGKGRHTTTTATLHALERGGFLVDTAGFKDFIAVDVVALEAAQAFPGFEEAIVEGCRFRDCVHKSEPDCGVLAGIEAGTISERRHRSYLQLLEELESSDGRS